LTQRGLRTPAESTIRRILTSHNLITPQPQKRPKSSLRRFEATLPNECWQAEVTYLKLLDGRFIEVLDFLDDHSRYLLYLVAHYHVFGPTVVTAMEEITSEHGLPQSTLTDNGLIFTARLAGAKGGKTGFEKFLETHSIKQKNGRPAHPQTQGKIERFHQTLKNGSKPDHQHKPCLSYNNSSTNSAPGTTPSAHTAHSVETPHTRPTTNCPKPALSH